MIFMQAQSLDNRSADLFVLEGAVVDPADAEALTARDTAARALMDGRTQVMGSIRVSASERLVVVEITTQQFDDRGRPAPVLVSLQDVPVDQESIPRLIADISAQAALIGRSFNQSDVADELWRWRRWSSSPKVRCARWLTRAGSQLRRWAHAFAKPFTTRSRGQKNDESAGRTNHDWDRRS